LNEYGIWIQRREDKEEDPYIVMWIAHWKTVQFG